MNKNATATATVATTTTSRNVCDSSGSYTHWVWERTGRTRPNPHTPTEYRGVEYSAPAEPVRPGQVCPPRWSVTRPTGRVKFIWD